MSIPAYVQPTVDFGNGYVLQPSDWNNNIDGISTYFNTTIKPAIDALQNGVAVQGAQGICQGRLSLTSGVGLTTGDVTNAGTLYFNPYNGNQVGLWTGTVWGLNSISAPVSLSLASILQWVNYDIFVYLSGGVLTLEAVQWASIAATNNPAAGSNVTISISSTANVSVGDWITVKAGATIELARVNTVNSNVSVVVDALANSYTTPTVYFSGALGRSIPLTLQNNVNVKSTSTSHLFLGTIRGSGAGVCDDSQARRFVWNVFQQQPRSIFAKDTTATWLYGTATWRRANAGNITVPTPGTDRTEFVIGLSGTLVDATYTGRFQSNTSAGEAAVGISIDSISATPLGAEGGARSDAGSFINGNASVRTTGYLSAGFHFVQNMEIAVSGSTITYVGTLSSAPATFQTGYLLAA